MHLVFDYFVSLGPECMLAASMSEYGLRAFSGIFDWIVTMNFNWVLHYIETDFCSFLLKINWSDTMNFNFTSAKANRISVFFMMVLFFRTHMKKKKYARRVSKFLEMQKHKVCFLRSVRSKEELLYIDRNVNYIHSVIKIQP